MLFLLPGVATIKYSSPEFSALNIQRSPVPVLKNKWYNFSVTHMQIETRSAWKTYSFLSSIDPYEYDVLVVEWSSDTSTAVTTYSTGFEPCDDQTQLNSQKYGISSPCQLKCLRGHDGEGENQPIERLPCQYILGKLRGL
ncbi:hypothetical protein ElyMa_005914400 [Elysia marginata]|uniref:Farnesoic acid O-methyl transferase domain-containing protein n=1 Tax=Elysia marginata TaxID=1093978 RepID=A0AAV4G752_9GAST|nr:hypothetical protein ElyMa_005914400 [Elysia marginata]